MNSYISLDNKGSYTREWLFMARQRLVWKLEDADVDHVRKRSLTMLSRHDHDIIVLMIVAHKNDGVRLVVMKGPQGDAQR